MDGLLLPIYVPRENAAEIARGMFEQFRWPPNGKPVCPECGSQWPIYQQSRGGVEGYYRCPSMHPHPSGSPKPLVFTVRTNTILARSHIPLEKWLHSLGLYGRLRSPHQTLSAIALAEAIDINRKTASSLLSHLYQLRYGRLSDDPAHRFLRELMAEQA